MSKRFAVVVGLALLAVTQSGCVTARLWNAGTDVLEEHVSPIRAARVGADGSVVLEADVGYRGEYTSIHCKRYIVFDPALLAAACRRAAAEAPGPGPVRVVVDGMQDDLWVRARMIPAAPEAADPDLTQLPSALRDSPRIRKLTRESLPYGREAVVVPYEYDTREFLLWIKPPIPSNTISQTPNRVAQVLLTPPALLLDGVTLPLQFLGAWIFLRDV